MGQANVVFLMLTQLGVCQQIEGEDSKLPAEELCSGEAHTTWCRSQQPPWQASLQMKVQDLTFPYQDVCYIIEIY